MDHIGVYQVMKNDGRGWRTAERPRTMRRASDRMMAILARATAERGIGVRLIAPDGSIPTELFIQKESEHASSRPVGESSR